MKQLFFVILVLVCFGGDSFAGNKKCRSRGEDMVTVDSYGTRTTYTDADGYAISKQEYDRQKARYNAFYGISSNSNYTLRNYGASNSTTYNYGHSNYTQYNLGGSNGTIYNYGDSNLTVYNLGAGRTTVHDSSRSRTSVYRSR